MKGRNSHCMEKIIFMIMVWERYCNASPKPEFFFIFFVYIFIHSSANMSLFGLKLSQIILHTETSKLMYNWSFLFKVLHKPTLLHSTFNKLIDILYSECWCNGLVLFTYHSFLYRCTLQQCPCIEIKQQHLHSYFQSLFFNPPIHSVYTSYFSLSRFTDCFVIISVFNRSWLHYYVLYSTQARKQPSVITCLYQRAIRNGICYMV